eukprot:Opistho-2@76888
MGNCCASLCGGNANDRSGRGGGQYRYLGTYSDQELIDDVEFDNLMDGPSQNEGRGRMLLESQSGEDMGRRRGSEWENNARILTAEEIKRLTQRKMEELVEEQRRMEIEENDRQRRLEEELKLEEEALIEAKKQAARAAKEARGAAGGHGHTHAQANGRGLSSPNLGRASAAQSAYVQPKATAASVGLVDASNRHDSTDDFDTFLENVKARSLNMNGAAVSSSSVYAVDDAGESAGASPSPAAEDASVDPPASQDDIDGGFGDNVEWASGLDAAMDAVRSANEAAE